MTWNPNKLWRSNYRFKDALGQFYWSQTLTFQGTAAWISWGASTWTGGRCPTLRGKRSWSWRTAAPGPATYPAYSRSPMAASPRFSAGNHTQGSINIILYMLFELKGTQAWNVFFFTETETLWSQGPVTRDFWKSYSIRPRYSTFKHFRVCSASEKMFELRNSGENRRKRSEIYQGFDLGQKNSKLFHACVPLRS